MKAPRKGAEAYWNCFVETLPVEIMSDLQVRGFNGYCS